MVQFVPAPVISTSASTDHNVSPLETLLSATSVSARSSTTVITVNTEWRNVTRTGGVLRSADRVNAMKREASTRTVIRRPANATVR